MKNDHFITRLHYRASDPPECRRCGSTVSTDLVDPEPEFLPQPTQSTIRKVAVTGVVLGLLCCSTMVWWMSRVEEVRFDFQVAAEFRMR